MTECQYNGRRCFLIPSGENLGVKQCSDHVDPDGHTYLRCEYFSNRTRIRCSSVRLAHELKPYGFCDKHNGFIERIRREATRARRILDPGYMLDNGLDANCSSDEFDEALEDSGGNWPYIFESPYCDTRIDNPDNPLRNAGFYTVKEIVQQYIDAIERQKEALLHLRIIYAEKHRRLIAERAKKRVDSENSTPLLVLGGDHSSGSLDPRNAPSKNKRLRDRYKAYSRYGSYLRWRRTAYFRERVFERRAAIAPSAQEVECKSELVDSPQSVATSSCCQHVEKINLGKPVLPPFNPGDMDAKSSDESVVSDLLTRIVDYVNWSEQSRDDIIRDSACNAPRVPLSDFCIEHIMSEETQLLFNKCVECEKPAMLFSEYRRCRLHYDKLTFGSSTRASSTANMHQQSIIIGDDLDSELYLKMCVDMAKSEQQQVKYHPQQQQPPSSSFYGTGSGGARAIPSSDKLLMTIDSSATSESHHHMPRAPGSRMHYAQHHPYADMHHPHPQFRSLRYQPKPGILINPEREYSCARIRPFSGNHRNRALPASSSISGTNLYSTQQHQLGPPIISPRAPQAGFSHVSPSTSQVYSPSHVAGETSQYAPVKYADGVGHHPESHHASPSSMHMVARRVPSQINNAQPTSFSYPIAPRRPPPQTIMGPGRGAPSMVRIMRGISISRGTPTARRARGTTRGGMLQSQLHLPYNQMRQ